MSKAVNVLILQCVFIFSVYSIPIYGRKILWSSTLKLISNKNLNLIDTLIESKFKIISFLKNYYQ